MNHYLTINEIGGIFKNSFGYSSRKILFLDPKTKLKKWFYLHERHEGHYSIWKRILKERKKAQIPGRIEKIELNEDIIKGVRSYRDATIMNYKKIGIFVIFAYHDLNSAGQMQMAMKDQLWEYVEANGNTFDPYGFDDDEYSPDS